MRMLGVEEHDDHGDGVTVASKILFLLDILSEY